MKVLVKGRWLTLSEASKLYLFQRPDTMREQARLSRAAETLGQRARVVREYQVIREPEGRVEDRRAPVPETWIRGPDYERALRLKEELVREFDGKPLEEAIPGKVISNDRGECYHVADEREIQFKRIDYERSRRAILSDLRLVYGIGPVTEYELKQQGYLTIEDLGRHPKWQRAADEFLKIMDRNDLGSLQSWFWRRLPKSHPLAHCLASFCKEEDFAALDIETLGLFGRAIILLGVGKLSRGRIHVSQFLLRDIPDEPGALAELVSYLGEKAALVTFNGRSFDVPYIHERFAFYGIDASFANPHFDLLHFARRAWQDRLSDCRLETIERYLGYRRDIDVPSALVPEFYEAYLKARNVGPLVAIVEHNRQDILTLASLLSRLYDEWDL